MVIKEVYTIPTFSDISTYLQLFLLNPILVPTTSIFFFTILKLDYTSK
jgi:hypothetical protein